MQKTEERISLKQSKNFFQKYNFALLIWGAAELRLRTYPGTWPGNSGKENKASHAEPDAMFFP